MASSTEYTVRTPFTLIVETSTLDNTWNTSVTLCVSNYKEYVQHCRLEVRTANCKAELYEQDSCSASWNAPPSERKGLSPVKCSKTNVDGFEGQFTYRRKCLAWCCEANKQDTHKW